MKQRIELVVFDMAGTTVNEDNVVYKTVQKVINDEGFSVSLEEVLKHAAGKEKHQAIRDILEYNNITDENKSDVIFEYFKETLDNEYLSASVLPIEGVENVFENN